MKINAQKIKYWLKKYWRELIIFALAAAFFIAASSFNYFTQRDNFIKWASPDETANYVFTKLYGQEGKIQIFEKYNLYVDGAIQPRSMRSDFGYIKPVSFLGIILIYGKIISLTGYKILPYLTPLFSAISIFFYYLLIKKIFGRRNAFISSFLLASFPPYIYYASRSMFHNQLFIILLIIGFYFLILMNGKKSKRAANNYKFLLNRNNWLYPALAGYFIGLTIITRSSELIWLMPMLIILWLFNIKKITIIKLVIFLSFVFIAILPALYWNQVLYQAPWRGGYTEMNQSITNISQASLGLVKSTFTGELSYYHQLAGKLKNNFFYFGFHFNKSWQVFYNYFIKMFYWLFWPFLLGLILFLQKWHKLKKGQLAFLASYFVGFFALLFYYGSWEFYDNPDSSQATIGNSYTRYWLLIYLGAMPFASITIIKLTRLIGVFIKKLSLRSNKITAPFSFLLKKIKPLFIVNIFRIAIIALIFFISIQFVLFGSEEGLIFTAEKHRATKNEYNKIINLTEDNSVIITQYHDKLLFPERKVIVGLFDNKKLVAKYAILTNYLPVYYYNFTLAPEAINYLNRGRLNEVGIKIEKVKKITGNFTLYKLEKKDGENIQD